MKAKEKKAPVGQRIIQRLEGFAEALEKKDVIAEKFTVRKMDLDLKPGTYGPDLVKATRMMLRASQAVFARFLGVSVKTVHAWEQGDNMPSDIACRFMDEIRHNPHYWLKRLEQAVVAR